MSLLLHTRQPAQVPIDTSPPVYFHSGFLGMTGLCWFLLLLPICLPVSPGLALQMYSQMSARGDGMKDEWWAINFAQFPVGLGKLWWRTGRCHQRICLLGFLLCLRISRLVKHHDPATKTASSFHQPFGWVNLSCVFPLLERISRGFIPTLLERRRVRRTGAGDALEESDWNLISSTRIVFNFELPTRSGCSHKLWPPKGMTRLNATRFVLPLQHKLHQTTQDFLCGSQKRW